MLQENKNTGIRNFLPPLGESGINYSSLLNYSQSVPSTNIYGIKYVEAEKEIYVVRNKRFVVKEKQFLVINKGQEFYIDLREKKLVKGFCINLDEALLQKVFYEMKSAEEKLLNYPLNDGQGHIEFHEDVFSSHDIFSNFLTGAIRQLRSNGTEYPCDIYSFYNEAAYHLLRSQKFVAGQIEKIKASKPSTKKEIFNRVNTAKNIIDNDITQKLEIDFLARESSLSEFHFYRSFKEAFGVTPHQYILKKRLEKSLALLQEGKLSVTDVAYHSGFNDVCAFSKSFKKLYKVAPTRLDLTIA